MTLGRVPALEKSDFETSKPHGGCDNGCMAARADYCHFTKAIEHLGDRWSLQIVRQLILLGPQGFNALRAGLPGIARSVLVDRLRKLDELGIVARTPTASGRASAYCVTPAGELLKPVMIALVEWAQRWDPDDPAAAARDPDLIVWLLSHRASTADLPSDQVVGPSTSAARGPVSSGSYSKEGWGPRSASAIPAWGTIGMSTSRPTPPPSTRWRAASAAGRMPSLMGRSRCSGSRV